MRIKKLGLSNFRCFEQYDLEFSQRFTLLIGDNGSGKTTILDGLAIALGAFLLPISEVSTTDKRSILRDDIRYQLVTIGQNIVKQTQDIIAIGASAIINNQDVNWLRYRNISNNRQYQNIRDIIPLVKDLTAIKDNINTLPIILYNNISGGIYLEKKLKTIEFSSPFSRFDAYQNCLSPSFNRKNFFKWFKTQELAALQKQERRNVLEVVREAIISMLPNVTRLWWDLDWDDLLVEMLTQNKAQIVPIRLLSAGYLRIIDVVFNIAYRMAVLNPQLENEVIKQTEGIVLIDEIDLHLHPNWQRIVVERLIKIFPKVQFVASTHSPFIIQSLYQRKECLLWDLEKQQALDIDSKSIEDIAEDLQGVEIPQQTKKYLDMMVTAENYYKQLHQYQGVTDEELMQLRTKLDELSIPFSDDAAFVAQLKFERDTVLATKNKK